MEVLDIFPALLACLRRMPRKIKIGLTDDHQ